MAFDVSLLNPGAGTFDISLSSGLGAATTILQGRSRGRRRKPRTTTVTVSAYTPPPALDYFIIDDTGAFLVDDSGNNIVWQ